jgi:acyl-CoA thioester hydrolase
MSFRLSIEVRYAETDAMGVVHHASYLVWLEAARVAFMNQLGYPYTRVEAEGLALVVSEVHLTYRSPARFGDTVEVETWLEEITARQAVFAYRVWRGEQLLAQGQTRHLAINQQGRATRVPAELLAALQASRDI